MPEEDRRKIVGKNLRAIILSRGYRTMEQFAHENELDKSWLNKVLLGQIDPGFTKVIRLAEALDVSLDSFFPRKISKKS